MMTLTTDEFIRRFLMLPAGFHRIRYYGLLASGKRADNIARSRERLTLPIIPVDAIKVANTTSAAVVSSDSGGVDRPLTNPAERRYVCGPS
jgi:hypothetical protein